MITLKIVCTKCNYKISCCLLGIGNIFPSLWYCQLTLQYQRYQFLCYFLNVIFIVTEYSILGHSSLVSGIESQILKIVVLCQRLMFYQNFMLLCFEFLCILKSCSDLLCSNFVLHLI